MTMVKRVTKLSFCMLLAMAIMVTPLVSAAGETTQPKTSPPPPVFQPFGMYTGYTYLWYSSIALRDNSNGSISVMPTTSSYSKIDELGAIVQLQRWTGTQWVDSGVETTLKALNAENYSGSTTKAATSGYYYRAKVIHYCKHGNVYEAATEYTGSILKS